MEKLLGLGKQAFSGPRFFHGHRPSKGISKAGFVLGFVKVERADHIFILGQLEQGLLYQRGFSDPPFRVDEQMLMA